MHKDRWQLKPDADENTLAAVLSGRFRNEAISPEDFPVVGDWVTAVWQPGDTAARILAIEPRSGVLARKRPGDVARDGVIEQVMAANIDLALLVMAVGEDFSVRRLERYLTMAWESGATPVVVLTKADLAADIDAEIAQARAVTFGATTLATSSRTGQGLTELRSLLKPGHCAILLGSSGVGKSSLLNALAGTEVQAVFEVRDSDGKGRHTTTARRLVELPWGAYLVDTPGLRELQLWGDQTSLTGSFPDVERLAANCRFSDCAHEQEPGCAVQEAAETGELPAERLASWCRLRRELAFLERKADGSAARAERQQWKSIAKQQKIINRER